ncbi:MAG: tetratricopeptide repeat protein [Deltaproteobacteria bacterium]|nr:tetratricopeptide repeat protein [Deltaproteobacteria bacterium]
MKRRNRGYCSGLPELIAVLCLLACCGESTANGLNVVQEVTTHIDAHGSAVLIKLTGYSAYKVTPIDDREIMIALKDMEVSPEVFGRESLVGDPVLSAIDVVTKPSKVACIVVKTLKSSEKIAYRIREQPNLLRVEFVLKTGLPELEPGSKVSAPAASAEQQKTVGRAPVNAKPQRSFAVGPGPAGRDTELFKQAMVFYEAGQWDEAVSALDRLIESYPKSRHLEPAHFLLAKSFHRRFASDVSKKLAGIVQHYQIAVSKFPESVYAPRALLAMGNCYFQAQRYYEAMTYYNMILEKYQDDEVIPEAMLQRGRVLALTEKPLVALQCFKVLLKRYPDSESAFQARLETAKTLFDMKSFKRSLKVLREIARNRPDQVTRCPEILLYMGYNNYELGRLQEARERLSRVVNIFPQIESADLVLTRIADTLREDGMQAEAMKLYDLVARTYPESEGSAISLIRLAEQAEKVNQGHVEPVEDESSPPGETKSAHDIYRKIIERFPQSPLAQVAMLKLGNLDKKSGNYENAIKTFKALLAKKPDDRLKEKIEAALQEAMLEFAQALSQKGHEEKSVDVLRQLLAEYPHTDLLAEVKSSLETSLGRIFDRYEQQGRTEQLVAYYERLKATVPFNDMPKLLVKIGDAYRALHFFGPALTAFEHARRFYGEQDLPAQFLIGLVQCALEEEKFETAQSAAEGFIRKYPSHTQVAKALLWRGRALLGLHRYEDALNDFRGGLAKQPEKDVQVDLLLGLARVSVRLGDYHQAALSFKKAIAVLETEESASVELTTGIYRELGEALFKQGASQQALSAFSKVLALKPNGPHTYEVQYRIAQCYRRQKAKDKAEELLARIAASGDPFWSKVAQSQINDMNIEKDIRAVEMGIKKS